MIVVNFKCEIIAVILLHHVNKKQQSYLTSDDNYNGFLLVKRTTFTRSWYSL